MARKSDTYHEMLQHYATARETRSSAMLANGRSPNDPIPGEGQQHKDHKRTASNDSSSTTVTNSQGLSGGEGTDETDGSGTCAVGSEGDDNGEDEDEPEGFAPSAQAKKRKGHQTGLSLTLTTTSLNAAGGRKRARSISSGDEDVSPTRVKRIFQEGAISTATSDDDDDDYNAVDLISDSDGEEPDLEQLEEKMIIDSEEEHSDEMVAKTMLQKSNSASSEDWHGFGIDEGLMLSDLPFFDEHIGRTHPATIGSELDIYHAAAAPDLQSSSPSPPVRRVRFVDDVYGSSTSTNSSSDVDNDAYPDLFMQQDRLDPTFRQMIENDNVDDNQLSTDGEGSYWELEETNEDFELEKHGLDADNSSGSSSGYETDEGETTDEEVLPPTTINRPQSLLRIQSPNSTRKSKPVPTRRTPLAPGARRQGPTMGSWVADPTKPIAVIDSSGNQLLFIAAPRPVRRPHTPLELAQNRSTSSSPQSVFASLANPFDSENDHSDTSGFEYGSQTLDSTANLMMSGLFHGGPGMEHIIGGQVIGPPEAFYPFKSIGADGNVIDDDTEYSDDDDENLWNIHDFIDFGEDSSDSDQGGEDDNDVTPTKASIAHASQRQFSPAVNGSAHGLLRHFDKGVVTSFRRNQHRHQTLLRRPPISTSGLYGLKGGRQTAANTPISPLRKRKPTRSMSSSMIPINGVAAQRRVVNHKRHKSMG